MAGFREYSDHDAVGLAALLRAEAAMAWARTFAPMNPRPDRPGKGLSP